MATKRKRSETAKTSARAGARKLSLKKETLKDLAPAREAAVKGGRKNLKSIYPTQTLGCDY